MRLIRASASQGVLDSLGDEGNKFARTTIMPQRYIVTKDPATMSMIASSNVLATLFCMFLVVGARQRLGLAVFTVFGNAFSCVVQYCLLWLMQGAPDTLVPYVGVWWLGACERSFGLFVYMLTLGFFCK